MTFSPAEQAAMTRALAVLTTLELGVTPGAQGDIGETLLHFYRAGKRTILNSVVTFEPLAISRLHEDFDDIRRSFAETR